MILELKDGSFLDLSTLVTAKPNADGTLVLSFSSGHAFVLEGDDAAQVVKALRLEARRAADTLAQHKPQDFAPTPEAEGEPGG